VRFIETELNGAYIIEPVVHKDHRGFFLESYSRKVFEDAGIRADFLQDNHSLSKQKGVIRGLHFQNPPHAQSKLIRVVKGSIYDVIVDLRKKSPTYGKWFPVEISADNFKMLFVPTGFAHGFCTLEENTEVIYKVDAFYAPDSDAGIRWNDPDLKISWPVTDPVISEKDKSLPFLRDIENQFLQ
jgi:dTDP-4-dehydrorhamnose 3,5-epimerase